MSSRTAYALAALIGVSSLLIVHGWDFVTGASRYWEMPTLRDHRMYVMGYRYFLHEPWHWPVFAVHTSMPFTRSIAFSDTPILWALGNKLLATVIPPWRSFSADAFLGLWYVVVAALQAVFGVANLRALGHRTWGATIVTSLFFIAIPAWTYRFPHASLSAHFVILWAFYLYLVTPAEASRRLRVMQVVQLLVASLLNAYLTVMSLAIFFASLARSRRSVFAWFSAGCGVVVAGLAFAGYFAAEGANVTYGFSAAGSNLLGPILPMDSGFVGNRLWVDVTGLQYEGICYLGAGVLVLVALAMRRSTLATLRRHRALAVIGAAAALFALSNHIYLGSHRLIAYPIPHLLHWFPDQFRCPGRFSWLPMYVVVIYALSAALTRFANGWRCLVLLMLAALQLFDVTPDWLRWRAYTAGPEPTTLDVPVWRRLLASVDEVEMVPAHDCNSDRSYELATQLEYLTGEAGTPINGIYSARGGRDCDVDTEKLLAFQPRPRTLYVFVAPMIATAKRLATTGLRCAEFDAGEVCSIDRALIDSLHWPNTPSPVSYSYGAEMDLTDPNAPYLEVGWASTQPEGRWTVGPVARLVATPRGDVPADPKLAVDGSALLCDKRTNATVDVAINGESIGALTLTSEKEAAYTIAVHREILLERPLIEIELRPRDFRSPLELGCRRMPRELAVRIHRVSIR